MKILLKSFHLYLHTLGPCLRPHKLELRILDLNSGLESTGKQLTDKNCTKSNLGAQKKRERR